MVTGIPFLIYCGSGVLGSVNLNFMKEIGLKAKLYAGSYSDWISYKENIVKTGEELLVLLLSYIAFKK